MNRTSLLIGIAFSLAVAVPLCAAATADSPAQLIREAGVTGGLVAQIGETSPSAGELDRLGESFHARILAGDPARIDDGRAEIVKGNLQGRVTIERLAGSSLPLILRLPDPAEARADRRD
jgi:hypothetical protein